MGRTHQQAALRAVILAHADRIDVVAILGQQPIDLLYQGLHFGRYVAMQYPVVSAAERPDGFANPVKPPKAALQQPLLSEQYHQ